ncbi:MAG: glutaredoxin 3 [Sphingobacteriia bacterium]|nr:glutaredoxin 3 [Sphingobacteriia bacterium]NCC37870.1 glutaredoxin 3 [Gammaproteobacteria bacterium]
MPHVTIYATKVCPYCIRARHLLERKGIQYEEIRVDQDRERMTEMRRRSRRATVPQIFIDDLHIGGYDDMARLDERGELDPLLGLSDE